jgi:hypothetical protein
VLGHAFDQQRFGRGDGLVFVAQAVEEAVIVSGVFPGLDEEGSAEAVAEVVLGGGGFAFFGTGAGGESGVGLIRG